MGAVNRPGPGSKVTGVVFGSPTAEQPVPGVPGGCEVTFDPGSPGSGRRNVIVPEC